MGAWRDNLLQYLRDDWKENENEPGNRSRLAEYFRELAEKNPRVRLKSAYADFLKERSEKNLGKLLDACIEIAQTHDLLELECWSRLPGIEDYRKGLEQPNQSCIGLPPEGNAQTQPDEETIISIAKGVFGSLEAPTSRGDLVALAKECYEDARAGDDALSTATEQEKLKMSLYERSSKTKLYRVEWPSINLSESEFAEFVRDVVIPSAINRRCYLFLDNAGLAPKGNGSSSKRKQHTYDIPIDLVEKCVMKNETLATSLEIESRHGYAFCAQGQTTASERSPEQKYNDLEKLYEALKADQAGDCSEAEADFVIPVEIDAETGMGLYVMGPQCIAEIREQAARDSKTGRRLRTVFTKHAKSKEDIAEICKKLFGSGSESDSGSEFTIPFFAVLYHSVKLADVNIKILDDESKQYSMQNIWDFVVDAWFPRDEDGFGKKAYDIFSKVKNERLDLSEYYGWNGNAPDGCPPRFRKYFLDGSSEIEAD